MFGLLGLKSTKASQLGFQKALSASTILAEPVQQADLAGQETVQSSPQASFTRPFVLGFVLSATSAGWWAWWASIGLGALNLAGTLIFSSFAVFITFYFGHITSDYTWYIFVSGIVAASKRAINLKVYTVILVATNIFMLGLGIYFILKSI
jgi:hypothetical protein